MINSFTYMLIWDRCSMFCFFFQAEDGIRDHCVTGVQTCALPISHRQRYQTSVALVYVSL